MNLEFDKQCRVNLCPKTVPPPDSNVLSIQKEASKGKPMRMDQLLIMEDGGNDNRIDCHRSASCRLSILEDDVELEWSSVYQPSRDVKEMKRRGSGEARRKIEISGFSDTGFETSWEASQEGLGTKPRMNPSVVRSSGNKLDEEACSSDDFFDIDAELNDRQKISSNELVGVFGNLFQQADVPANDSSELTEGDKVQEEKPVESPQSRSFCQSCDSHSSASTISRFSPIKKMMDPFLKFKSNTGPPHYQSGSQIADSIIGKKMRNVRMLNSVQCNLQDRIARSDSMSSFHKELVSGAPDSPALLHACLKVRTKDRIPLFKFTSTDPEVGFVARIWKEKGSDAGMSAYTIQSASVKSRTHRDITKWGSKENSKELPIIGQMQVSSHLCSETCKDADNVLETEFVLYEIANARKLMDASPKCSLDVRQLHKETEETIDDLESLKLKSQAKLGHPNIASPWESVYLHPYLETAAIVIQIPFEKRESLKFSNGRNTSDWSRSDFKVVKCESVDVPKVIAVAPTGRHSLPNAENQGPSSLFDRWRLGGGCECGGWDMGCPLTVFSNREVQNSDDSGSGRKEITHQYELVVQGRSKKTLALSLKAVEDGKYDVIFHARLSAIQAFSISIALLHGSVASSAGKDSNTELSHCSLVKLRIDEEIERLTEVFAVEDTKDRIVPEKRSHSSFAINPPFSPISRV